LTGGAEQQAEDIVAAQQPDRLDQQFLAASSVKRVGQRITWLPSGTRSSVASLISRSARTTAGSKRSKFTPGEIVTSFSAKAGKRATASLATCSDTAITASARVWRPSMKRSFAPSAIKGACKVAIHLAPSRRATARATHAVAGDRACTTVTPASRKPALSLAGRMSRAIKGLRPSGISTCRLRWRSRTGTITPLGDATIDAPSAAIAACAASSVARARPPPARLGTI